MKEQIYAANNIYQNTLERLKAEFKTQAELANNLAKGYVAHAHGCVEESINNKFYIFMEYMPNTLEAKIYEHEQSKDVPNRGLGLFRAFPEHVRFYYYKLMFEGLEKIHQANYVHNDIKPGNILFDLLPKPQIRIIDFGMAEQFDTYPRGGTHIHGRGQDGFFSQLKNNRCESAKTIHEIVRKTRRSLHD